MCCARVRQVCQQLKQAPDETLLDGELKRCLGYRGLPGHRAWAKVRRKMVELDVLHVYLGALNGRPVTICKMLKPLQVAGKVSCCQQDTETATGQRAIALHCALPGHVHASADCISVSCGMLHACET